MCETFNFRGFCFVVSAVSPGTPVCTLGVITPSRTAPRDPAESSFSVPQVDSCSFNPFVNSISNLGPNVGSHFSDSLSYPIADAVPFSQHIVNPIIRVGHTSPTMHTPPPILTRSVSELPLMRCVPLPPHWLLVLRHLLLVFHPFCVRLCLRFRQ